MITCKSSDPCVFLCLVQNKLQVVLFLDLLFLLTPWQRVQFSVFLSDRRNVERGCSGHQTRLPTLTQLVLVLLTETVSSREEVPASLLVHLPHIGLLTRVLSLVLVDQVHEEEQVVGQVVLL